MMTACQTLNYLMLLRALFKSIGNCIPILTANDNLYQEFVPHLKTILTGRYIIIHHMLAFNRCRTSLKYGLIFEVIIELSLSVPPINSNLVPHMPLIMEPLVTSLMTSSAITSQGHRTLELCLNTLNILFVDNMLDDIRNDILVELCRRASQNSEPSLLSMKLIGKMSSSSVKPYHLYQKLKYVKHQPSCYVNLNHTDISIPISIPFDEILKSSVHMISKVAFSFKCNSSNDVAKDNLLSYAQDAWNIIKSYVRLLLPADPLKPYLPYLLTKILIDNHSEDRFSGKSYLKIAFLGLLQALHITKFRVEAIQLVVYSLRTLTLLSLLPSTTFVNQRFDNFKIVNERWRDTFFITRGYYADPCAFISPIFTFITTMNGENQQIASFLISLLVSTTYKYLEKTSLKFVESKIYRSIKKECIKYCNKIHYSNKYTCAIVIKHTCFKMDIEDLKSELCSLLNILFNIIAGLFSEISSGTVEYAADIIQSLTIHVFKDDQSPPIATQLAEMVIHFSLNQDELTFFASISPPYLTWCASLEYVESITNSVSRYILI
ncbi:hypothetical protein MXB_1432 [Myxobolus squamalis]|nr:hypothetical protein MXB_1432 [Myxobolus squamalis]